MQLHCWEVPMAGRNRATQKLEEPATQDPRGTAVNGECVCVCGSQMVTTTLESKPACIVTRAAAIRYNTALEQYRAATKLPGSW